MTSRSTHTVLWDDTDPSLGVVVYPKHLYDDHVAQISAMRTAVMLNQLRAAGPWGATLADNVEAERDDLDPSYSFAGDGGRHHVREWLPAPWDADVLFGWLPGELSSYVVNVGGASPGGNIDIYSVPDPALFRAALEEHGFTISDGTTLAWATFGLDDE